MTNRILNLAKAIALVTVIPVVSLCISYLVSNSYQSELVASAIDYARENGLTLQPETLPNYRTLCAEHNPEDAEFCEPAVQLQIFEFGAYACLTIGLCLFGLMAIGRLYAGHNRERLAFVLPILIRVMVFCLGIAIALQGAVAVFGIYILEATYLGTVHFVVLAGIGFAALVGAVNLIETVFKAMRNLNLDVQGIVIDDAAGPELIQLIHEVADQVGAQRPSNIVVGLTPNFFVTGANVTVYPAATDLTGSTLYLPVTFLRILSEDELRAVIGHEMGHFIGKDTDYSLKFYPAYARLESAMHSLVDVNGRIDLVAFPTLAFLRLLHDEFSVVERKIGREREITADQVGAGVSSSRALATALLKFSEYAELWTTIQEDNIAKLNQGEFQTDLAEKFIALCEATYAKMDFAERKNDLLAFKMTHPYDTHPTLSDRLLALGVDNDVLTQADMKLAGKQGISLLSAYATVAAKLSKAEHRKMIGLGFADPPSYAELRDD